MLLNDILMHKDTVLAVIGLINLFSFCLFVYDKSAARKRGVRIPEKWLLIFAALFGSGGAFVGMYLLRHKTRKPKFFVTVPLLLLIHGLILYCAGIIK